MERIRFFVPGPAWVRAEVREAMSAPTIGHRGAAFAALYGSLQQPLREIFRTRGEVLLATGSATLVMESAVVSTVAGSVLHTTAGAFAERWLAISRSHGLDADQLAVPWGQAVDPDLLRQALRRKRYDAVTVTHNETSTGTIHPLAELARVVREESDALVLVDAVSSLGGAEVETDAWDLDVVLAGSQKALAAPPGLAVFTLSERAAARAAAVAHRGFYTDLLRYRRKHQEGGTITTPAIPILFALQRQLVAIGAEGIETRWARHRELHAHAAAWAAREGFAYASGEGAHSPTVACLKPPAGVEAPTLVSQLAKHGYTVGGGYGAWKPTTFRVGHMGEVQAADLDELLA
ncbi:MAG: pyridoxal-phosphate-dependent aminotransferase family protein, partial [Thermoanaerobaculia bacterium]